MAYVYDCLPPAGPIHKIPHKPPPSLPSCLEVPKVQERGLRRRKSAKNDLISDSLWTAIQEEINGMCLVIEIWNSYSSKHSLILPLEPTP